MAAAHAPKPPAMHPYRETESRSSREAKPRQTLDPQSTKAKGTPQHTSKPQRNFTRHVRSTHTQKRRTTCVSVVYNELSRKQWLRSGTLFFQVAIHSRITAQSRMMPQDAGLKRFTHKLPPGINHHVLIQSESVLLVMAGRLYALTT